MGMRHRTAFTRAQLLPEPLALCLKTVNPRLVSRP